MTPDPFIKPIIVSPHAFERIQERGIVRHQVEAAIHTPDLKEAAKRGRLKVVKRFDNKVLHVFYRETQKSFVFVTAYWSKL